ncbi:MAG: hypothetical protein IMZ47_03105, partial [Firmicutes bacterium]|nr:hypothetical protein [Bacillota bacterium]
MATKTGNKWSTAKCGLCDQAHYRYSGKLDVKGIEYVTCGQTRKRMNVTGKDYEKTRAIVIGKTQSFPTEWVKEQRYVDYVSEHLAVLGAHDHQLFKQLWNGLVT